MFTTKSGMLCKDQKELKEVKDSAGSKKKEQEKNQNSNKEHTRGNQGRTLRTNNRAEVISLSLSISLGTDTGMRE
jgi:hypothetical protein